MVGVILHQGADCFKATLDEERGLMSFETEFGLCIDDIAVGDEILFDVNDIGIEVPRGALKDFERVLDDEIIAVEEENIIALCMFESDIAGNCRAAGVFIAFDQHKPTVEPIDHALDDLDGAIG